MQLDLAQDITFEQLVEEGREWFDALLSVAPIEKRIEGIPVEDIVNRISVEDRLGGLSAETIQAYLDKLKQAEADNPDP